MARADGAHLSLIGSAAESADRGLLDGGLAAFVHLLDLRDGHTARHSKRVAELAVAIGRRLGSDGAPLATLEQAAHLHDLGKIGVPDRILRKNGPLDADEWAVMQCHPVWGAEALAGVPGLEHVATVVRFHHERWDGRGYPDGLAGNDIPQESRIVGACDAFCSITADRPYRAALGCEQAVDLLATAAGQQFDPDVIDALAAAIEERPELSGPGGPAARTGRFTRTASATSPGPQAAPSAAPAAGERRPAMAKAIAALGALPALAESRQRLLRLLDDPNPPSGRIADVIEADPGLTAIVLRSSVPGTGGRLRPGDVPEAVRALGTDALRGIAESVRVFDFFQQVAGWRIAPERFRLHAVATQRAARQIARTLGHDAPDTLAAAALLHDVGKLVLAEAHDGYPARIHGDARTPRDRLRAERRALGMDHAAAGALVLRQWRLPKRVTAAVAAHHDPNGNRDAQVLGLADMLAHYAAGTPVDPAELLQLARALHVAPDELRALMFDLQSSPASRPDHIEPCPLSEAELAVLRGLAEGKRNKVIAAERGISDSTVRTQLHTSYRKLGVSGRAQAVLLATERGWL